MPGMAPNEIRAELIRRDIKVADIARECGVTSSAASQVIMRLYRGERIRHVIARRLGLPYAAVWGEEDQRTTAAV